MHQDRPLRLEVLINSPGPHDQVRMREPFRALKAQGIDCRLHERPFRLSQCIRPHSMVIWQRPLPENWSQWLNQLRWMRERGCLLLTEWDDHPVLFSQGIQSRLNELDHAPLRLCHAIHSSTPALCSAFRAFNPLGMAIDNGVPWIPAFDHKRQLQMERPRVLIGNQNRYAEHAELKEALVRWMHNNPALQVVVIGDPRLSNQLQRQSRPDQILSYGLLDYYAFRSVMRSCHLSLLPLLHSAGNRCKTVIKWVECAAESVVCLAGPELYHNVINDQNGVWVNNIAEMIPAAEALLHNPQRRLALTQNAHHQVVQHWELRQLLPQRLWLYEQLWRKREAIDRALLQRWPQASTESAFPL